MERRSNRINKRLIDYNEDEDSDSVPSKKENKNVESDNEIHVNSYPTSSVKKEKLRCLICCDKLKYSPTIQILPEKRVKDQESSVLKENLGVILLLTRILNLSLDQVIDLLNDSNGQNPRDWISLCTKCRNLVHQAYSINQEIKKLEGMMRTCKKTILERIQATRKWQEQYIPGERRTSQKIRSILNEQMKDVDKTISYPKVYADAFFLSDDDDYSQDESEEDESPKSTFWNLWKAIDEKDWLPAEDEDTETLDLPYERITSPISSPLEDINSCDEDSIGQFENVPSPPANAEVTPASEELVETTSDLINTPKKKRRTKESCNTDRDRPYRCLTCPYLAPMNFHAFIAHIVFHWKRPNKCTSCFIYLPLTEEAIEKHWKDCHADIEVEPSAPKYIPVQANPGKVWMCGKCPKRFSTSEKRNEHEIAQHETVLLVESMETCSICSLGFRDVNELRFHKAITHPHVSSLSCCYCDEYLPLETVEGFQVLDTKALQEHIKLRHPLEVMTRFNGKLVAKQLCACPLCGLVLKIGSAGNLDTHILDKHGYYQTFTCSICSKEMTHLCGSAHLYLCHVGNTVCDVCGEGVKPGGLPTHMIRKHGIVMEGYKEKRCIQEGCDFVALTSYTLKKHMLTHKKDRPRPYTCQFCGKGFTCTAHAKKHESIHTNKYTKPFQCELCGKSFAVKEYLRIHKQGTHFGNPNYRKRRLLRRPTAVSTNSASMECVNSGQTLNELPSQVGTHSSALFPSSEIQEMDVKDQEPNLNEQPQSILREGQYIGVGSFLSLV